MLVEPGTEIIPKRSVLQAMLISAPIVGPAPALSSTAAVHSTHSCGGDHHHHSQQQQQQRPGHSHHEQKATASPSAVSTAHNGGVSDCACLICREKSTAARAGGAAGAGGCAPQSKVFHLRVAVLTISDRCSAGTMEDKSGVGGRAVFVMIPVCV